MIDAEMQVWRATGAASAEASTGAVVAREWCIQPRGIGNDARFVGHVLVHAPQSAIDSMRQAARAREATAADVVAEAVSIPVAYPGAAPAPASPPPAASASGSSRLLGASEVEAIAATMSDASFSADRLAALGMAVSGRRLTVAQATRLVEELAFSVDRIAAVQMLRPCIVDPQNAFHLLALFPFSADKAAVEAIFR